MQLSHLGLTVSHIPSATSFYLACLQPLGYRYIGYQGDSIGLGISTADLFLSQEQHGDRIAPTHVAFAAKDRHTVRDCYAAALRAGAAPSGAPSYRNDECTCFNAAVHDLDGNTIEFVYNETCAERGPGDGAFTAASQHSRGPRDQRPEAEWRGSWDDARSSRSMPSRADSSRGQTALDLASATSRSISKSDEPTPGIVRSRTEPIVSKTEGKALMGTILGAAAGAAFVYAAWSTERSNARDEADYNASLNRSPSNSAPSGVPTSRSIPKRSESTSSRKYPPRSMGRVVPRVIEAPPVFDEEVWETSEHYTAVHRPAEPARSRTYTAPPIEPVRRDKSRGRIQTSSTLPVNPTAPSQPTRAPSSSRQQQPSHSIRRSSTNEIPPSNKDKDTKSRHDSVVGPSAPAYSRRRSEVPDRRSSNSTASTIRPAQQRTNSIAACRDPISQRAEDVPLPASHAGSYISASASASASAAQVSLPASRVSSSSYRSARDIAPMPSSVGSRRVRSRSRDVPATSSRASHAVSPDVPNPSTGREYDGTAQDIDYESDGLGDCKTVVPDDSISCVDFSSRDSRTGRWSGSVRRSSAAPSQRQSSVRSSSQSQSKTKSSGRRSETSGSQRTARQVARSGPAPSGGVGDGRGARTVVNLPARSKSKREASFRGWHSVVTDTH